LCGFCFFFKKQLSLNQKTKMPKATTKKAAVKKTVSSTVKKAAPKAVSAKKDAPAKKAVPAKRAIRKAVPTETVAPVVAPKKVAAKKVAAKKTVARKEPVKTTVIAKFDAGFGNHLAIRGNCSGLTWDSGAAMENVGSDEWVWSSTVVTSELEFKVLLNDEIWSTGSNGVVFPGATVVFQPSF
jgi:hypothetical protein